MYRKFSFTQNQKLCKFFDLWASNIFPEAISVNFAEQEESVESPKKNTILPKEDIYISSQGQNSLSTTSFPDLGASSQKKCLCTNSQLSNYKTLVSGLMFCIERSIEHICVVVARVKFTFHLINGRGVEPADYLEL